MSPFRTPVLLLAAALALPVAATAPVAAQRTKPAAAAALAPDVAYGNPDGSVHRLSEATGLVHFVFVARWAPPSEAEVNALRRMAGQLQHRGNYQIVLVGVSRRQTGAEFADWVRGVGFDGPRVYDGDGALERAFGAEFVPWHVVVGPGRHILASGERCPARATIEQWLSRHE